MKIVVISTLDGDLTRGPNNSVPNQVHNLVNISGVEILWINMSDVIIESWSNFENFYCTNSLSKIKSRLDEYSPEIVIFQQVYYLKYYLIANWLRKRRIHYVIIPRSSLTYSAQKRHKVKKLIGNLLFFKKFIEEASSIHFLTKNEYLESVKFNIKHYYIVPNGINFNLIKKKNFNESAISAIFIGRVEIFQKGLDMLVKAINFVKDELRNNSFILNIYGPSIDDSYKYLEQFIEENDLSDLIILNDSINGKQKKEVLENSDIFILTSRFEGLSMSLLEALSFGVPVMITEGTNFVKEVQEFNAGWTADNNEKSISETLLTIVKEREKFKSKSLAAITLAKNYDWESISKETIRILANIVTK